jgi:hypothetical protein
MVTSNKNILYTYVQPNISLTHCLVQVYSLCLSVQLVKKNLEYKKIKLYTTPEVRDFFKDTDYFDEIHDITFCSEYIENQDPGILHKNMLYKIFVPPLQTEPFIHIDNDFYINDGDVIKYGVNQKVFFGLKENVLCDNTKYMKNGYYHYFINFMQVVNYLNKEDLVEFNNFNPMNAFNCSIFGCDNDELIKSFTKVKDFFVKHYQKLNEIPNIPSFIEQYLQVSYLLEENDFLEIYTFEDLLYWPKYMTIDGFNVDVYVELKEKYLNSKLVHLSGSIWTPYYQVMLTEQLETLDPLIVNKLVDDFGEPEWFKYRKLLIN